MRVKILEKLNDKIQLKLFKLAHKIFYREVDDEICDCMQMEVLYEHFDYDIYFMGTSKEIIESDVGLVIIPILDVDYYEYLKDKKDLFVSANNRMPKDFACASVNEIRDGLGVFVINKKSMKNISGKFTELKSFWNIGQLVALLGLSLSILAFNIKLEKANLLNNFLFFIIYLVCLIPVFLFQNDFLWYASRHCPNPKKLSLISFSMTLILSTLFIILLYILNAF